MSLRVEEDLDVHGSLRVGSVEIRPGQAVEVIRVPQHVGTRIVDVQKRLQIGELVGPPQILDGRVRQPHPVLGRQLKGELGLERALDMHVQLRFRQSSNKLGH